VNKRFTSAFSLIELTLAIGVAAFCLIAVFGLIPVGIQTNRNATSQTAAKNILAAVLADLRATPKAGPTPAQATSYQFGITFGTNRCQSCSQLPLYFDSAGQFSCDSAGSQRFNPSPPPGTCSNFVWTPPLQLRYRLTITWAPCSGSCPVQPCSGTCPVYVNLKVTWPAAVDPATTAPSGSVEAFAALDRN
jgi:type II secretory pathway pseudopilin PulG